MPPGKPVVVDISETRCTLKWEPSGDDGGADVKHYLVEYFRFRYLSFLVAKDVFYLSYLLSRDVWNVWLKAKTVKDPTVVIDDLIPGSRFVS